MRQPRRGLSFIELVMAMSVTFLAITFLMGVFVTGIRHAGRSRHTAVATTLAQSKLERLSVIPPDRIVACSDKFPGTEYTYSVDLTDAGDYDGNGTPDPDMKLVTLTVTAPDGARTALSMLRPAPPPLFGLACPAAQAHCMFAVDETAYPYPMYEDTASCINDPSYYLYNTGIVPDPTMPNQGRPGCLACSDDGQNVWAVDFVNLGIRTITQGQPSWSALLKPPGLGRPTGLACSSDSKAVWLADESNRCLWHYSDTPTRAGPWTGPFSTAGLGRLKGLACDNLASTVWVADADNNCVRRFDAATGTWDPTKYTNPDLNEPIAVAMLGDGSKVYVMDSQYLHTLTVSSNTWQREDLPNKLREDGPQGLAVNSTGDQIFASPRRGPVYSWDPGNLWVELDCY